MSESNRTYRVRTNVNSDKFVTFDLEQGIDVLEILSLSIDTRNYYKLHTSDYGCIVGRVLANGGVGIPNAKISVFFGSRESIDEDSVLYSLYPFSSSFSKDSDGIRYNLLPDTSVSVCHTPIGTFPDKRLTLDDENVNEVYEKYYTYTTRTNDAGDYMLFGVPVGSRVLHVDIDLSDIGMLSQKPYDMIYKGYNITQFENANKFKKDTNLDNLTQVITQNDSIEVYPFWGDGDENTIKITRHDIDVQYKFEPSCVFLGSLVTDEKSNGIQKNCVATERMGKMDRLTTGSGMIEMIRKCSDGSVEEFQVQGNQLIDGNGTWCYQIPMNLDYYMTDEYGNFVPSDEKEKGIPTRTRVRFRVSLTDFQSDYHNNHLSKVLIPNNPKTYDDLDYNFGSYTTDSVDGTKSFRDLFWNNVYTVKSYIPRIQKGGWQRNKRFTGIKNVNVNEGNNPIPYNNMRVNLTFMFVLQCAILKFLVAITRFVNSLKRLLSKKTCSYIGDGVCPDLENWYFAPGCKGKHLDTTLEIIKTEDDPESVDSKNRDEKTGSTYCITNKTNYLIQCIEINLAMEYNVIQFDFYNDWINGMIYVPRWFVNIKRKRSYLFGLFHSRAKIEACMEDTFTKARRYTQQCSLQYERPSGSSYYTNVASPRGCKNDKKQKCHRGPGREHVHIFKGRGGGGLVHHETTFVGDKVYYFKPAEWLNVGGSDFNTRCPLFATDIVLLGSLDKYNEKGLPSAFEELVSSTYLMPSNLAATNMDKEGFMYGIRGLGGTKCTSKVLTEREIVPFEQTFENYVEWSKGTDYFEQSPDDVLESPVTEASGIDWGYSGPRQGSNSLSDLYFPGGHFLGISCVNSEVNIKSCVNLSRICEMGSMMSQRQTVMGYNGANGFNYGHLMPTGLISKNEINDGNFRKMFATMNYNGLRTKRNSETSYLEYDFTPLLPTNFSGDLSKYVNNSTNYNGKKTTEITGTVDTDLFTSTPEKASDDYYRFRMGVREGETNREIRNHYLIHAGNKVQLPVYDNSFYFYFGLKDGNTALDRFFKDFYASCDTNTEDDKRIIISSTPSDFCSVFEGTGTASVKITDIPCPYTMMLKRSSDSGGAYILYISETPTVSITGEATYATRDTAATGYSQYVPNCYEQLVFTNLQKGNYSFTFVSEIGESNTVNFSVDEEVTGAMAAVNVASVNFVDDYEVYDEDTLISRDSATTFNTGGYIVISDVQASGDTNIAAMAILTDEKAVLLGNYTSSQVTHFITVLKRSNYTITSDDLFEYNSSWESGDLVKTYTVPAWRGNEDYYIVAIGDCDKATTVSTANIEMSTGLDLAVGDSDLTYKTVLEDLPSSVSGYVNSGWVENILTDNVTYNKKKRWNVKHSVFFRTSLFSDSPQGDLNVFPMNGVYPYKDVATGKVETAVSYDTDQMEGCTILAYTEDVVECGYKMVNGVKVPIDEPLGDADYTDYYNDMHEFYFPTHYIKNGNIVSLDSNVLPEANIPGHLFNWVSMPNSMYGSGSYAPPIYKYLVDDSSDNGPLCEIELPSIYKPFYMNGIKYLHNTGSVVNVYSYVNIVNPILLTDDPNDQSGQTWENLAIIDGVNIYTIADDLSADLADLGEYNIRHGDFRASYYDIPLSGDTGLYSFDVSFSDAKPRDYDGSVNLLTIRDAASCLMPTAPYSGSTGSGSYSKGVKFYIPTTSIATVSSDMSTIFNESSSGNKPLSYSYMRTNSPYKWRGIWGYTNGSGVLIPFADITPTVYSWIYGDNATTEVAGKDLSTSWKRFCYAVKDVSHASHVFAIYDNWTRTDTANADDTPYGNMFRNYAPDTNIMSIVRYYDSSELN